MQLIICTSWHENINKDTAGNLAKKEKKMLVTLSILGFLLGKCSASPFTQLLQTFVLNINEFNAF